MESAGAGSPAWRCWRQRRGHWKPNSCLRCWPVRALLVVMGWVLACGVGVVLWRGALQSMEDEMLLKCQNRKEVLKSEVENHLNASFVMVGLVASVPELNEEMWASFARRTLFLRPNVKRLMYVERVLANERAAFERKWNSSILYFTPKNEFIRREENDTEYSPIVFETDDEHYQFVDSGAYPLYRGAIYAARDTGRFTLSPITLRRQTSTWQMGAYLAYYGPGRDYTSFSSVEARRSACVGYVGAVFNATDVFYRVLLRFTDDVDMDVVAVFIVDPASGLQSYYNCSTTSCAIPLFDPARRASEVSRAAVSWAYGTQHFEVRCLPKHNLRLLALRAVIAWPLLMSLVVFFFSVIVYLVLKRMQAIEKDVAVMERMNEDLKVAKLAAEAADKAKSNFLATVSHEIRTPMNGVIGMTNLLMGTDLTTQQLEYVMVAQASGNSLIALINDVLDLSKIEAGRMELESVAFNIRKEVDNVFHLFDERVQQKKIEMSMLVHDTVPACILGDPARFRQILGNLIGNSLKFTKEGSILVCVRVMDHNEEDSSDFTAINIDQKTAGDIQLSQVLPKETLSQVGVDKVSLRKGNAPPRLSIQPGSESNCKDSVETWRKWKLTTVTSGENCLKSSPNHFTIITSVEDTGIGIPHHLEHRLFQPFSQANSSTSREHGGTGIGLSICQKLVKLMNGEITVKSKVGAGSVFEFTLPAKLYEGTKPCCSVFPVEENRLKGMHVTLVDSNLVRQEVSASCLRCLGIHVELAEDVESALEILKTGGTRMQAILIDLEGFLSASVTPLANSIRNTSTLKALPVLALSLGPPPPSVESELKDAGVSYIVHKPLRYSTLACVLLEAIGISPKPFTKKLNKVNDHTKLLTGKRLLVVDDNMVNRKVATSMLKKYGAVVSSVNSGGEAVSAVENQREDEKLDLVLMDIQMPEMDGWEATRRIRSWEVENCTICRPKNVVRCDHHRLPIVALTADALKRTHAECINSGMDDYLTKPLDQKHLQSLLERFIRNEMHGDPPTDEQQLSLIG